MTYAVAYKFTLLDPSPLTEELFTHIWAEITEYFRDHCDALGSRLHKTSQGEFHAYAQWPSKAVMAAVGDHVPSPRYAALRMKWAELCGPSEILFEGPVLEDLFVT